MTSMWACSRPCTWPWFNFKCNHTHSRTYINNRQYNTHVFIYRYIGHASYNWPTHDPPPKRQNGAVHALVLPKLAGQEAETLSTALKTQQKATIRRERQREMEQRSDGHMCGPETKVDYTCTCDRWRRPTQRWGYNCTQTTCKHKLCCLYHHLLYTYH